MSRMFGYLSAKTTGSSSSLSELDQVASLKETLDGLDALLNDDLIGAENILASGNSAFHKTGHAAVSYLRALIGFEQEMLKQATERIVDAEAAAERQRKLVVKDNRSMGRYYPGAEYTLCIALSLLMSAVVSFLNESVVESLKGAYKLRKSYQLFHKLFDMIVDVDGTSPVDSTNGTTKSATPDSISETSEDDFVDATDNVADLATPTALSRSIEAITLTDPTQSDPFSLNLQDTDVLEARPTSSANPPTTLDRRASIASVSTFHEIPTPPTTGSTLTDETIYSGTLMALGAIMLMISLLPPSLSRILSIIGFRGSRSQALSMLWKVSSQPGPFGSLGTFVLGTYYGNIVLNCDIISEDYTSGGQIGETTLDRLYQSISRVRIRYPASALWAVEEARMESIKGNLDEVVHRLSTLKVNTQMPQMESLVIFEGALHNMMTHQYENAAQSFLNMCSKNNWSHGLYTYIAGICYAELSRQNPQNKEFAKNATSLLDRIPGLLAKRKGFGGRRIPFEQFVERKINRFKSMAKTNDIISGVGGPVTEEILYLLCNGQKRMRNHELEKSWKSLELWTDGISGDEEIMSLSLMKSVIDRHAGRLDVARSRIEMDIIAEGLYKKVPLGANDWVAAYAYYEMGVISWMQKRPTEEVKGWLKRASDQGDFPLSNRLSIRIQVAHETLKRK